MSGTRKIAAILVADVVGYGHLASTDEERTLARLRTLLGDLIEPAIAAHLAGSSSAPATGSSLNSAVWSMRRVAQSKCRPE
jgi:hypothetical protein